jgi:hypothetical protein
VNTAIILLSTRFKVKTPGGGPEVPMRGVEGLIQSIEAERKKDPRTGETIGFLYGYVFQVERMLHYFLQGKLVEVEHELQPGNPRSRRVDIVSSEPDGSWFIETKNWTQFEKWDEVNQRSKLGSLYAQLAAYLERGKVRLEWRGSVPAAVSVRLDPLARQYGPRFEVVSIPV